MGYGLDGIVVYVDQKGKNLFILAVGKPGNRIFLQIPNHCSK
jgi:hypothetical protein